MNQRERITKYLIDHGSITRKEAESLLGVGKRSFWSIICTLKKRGMYITIHRDRFDPMKTTYILGTEEDRAIDISKPHYSYSNNRRLWDIWRHMRERCGCSYHKSYADYGGRGIQVCDEWEESFENFAKWAYANGYDDGASFMECTIDRIDPNGNYEPSNCRWVTMKEQCNNRRTNRLITLNGTTKTLSAWADETRIPSDTIAQRLKIGWSIEKALSTPIKKQKNNRCDAWIASIAE